MGSARDKISFNNMSNARLLAVGGVSLTAGVVVAVEGVVVDIVVVVVTDW